MDLPVTILASTLNAWAAERIAPIYRESRLLGAIQTKGRMKKNVGGKQHAWAVKYYRQRIRNVQGAVTQVTFENVADTIHMVLPFCGYDLGRSITKFEKLANQGKDVQIYDLLDGVMDGMMDDFREEYRLRLWGDGNQTGIDLMGVLTLFGGSSTPNDGMYTSLGTYTPLTTSTTGSNWWACNPTATYAGQPTSLGYFVDDYSAQGGDVAFPEPYYSPSYNVLSPLIVDYNSRQFTPNPSTADGAASKHSWQSQWQEAFLTLNTWLGLIQKKEVPLTFMDPALLIKAETSIIGQQRIIVDDTQKSAEFGFKTLSYSGSSFATEYGVPNGGAFAIPLDEVELMTMQSDLIARTEDSDIVTSEDLMKLDAYTLLKFPAPSHAGLLCPATTSGT